MNFFLLLLGIWLLPKVDSLDCYRCDLGPTGSCADQKSTCPTKDYKCASIRTAVYAGGSAITDEMTKGCALDVECDETSVNFGVSKTKLKTTCCQKDLCNSKVPELNFKRNGRKCFTCEEGSCTKTLNCEGTEDHCITVNATEGGVTLTMMGCASKKLCSTKGIAGFPQLRQTTISCCKGNFCNSASGRSAGLLLLLGSLISLVLFS